ncbi:MAG: nucleotidyltransferase family protein [Betaproteobacteria bacterium]|nr:nucleotidyltransferase family protein [Betaproteobacteria bacterium]
MNPDPTDSPVGIRGVLLAAGRGNRFGADKLLHPLADGTPMVLHSARRLRAAVPEMLVVVRPGASALMELLACEHFHCVVAEHAEAGMGHSVAAAVAAMPEARGWVIALADMPFVRVDTIAQVLEALRAGKDLVAPRFRGHRGNPVGIGGRFRQELLALEGDAGARRILQANAQHLFFLEVDDPGVLHDVDTPSDLEGSAVAAAVSAPAGPSQGGASQMPERAQPANRGHPLPRGGGRGEGSP